MASKDKLAFCKYVAELLWLRPKWQSSPKPYMPKTGVEAPSTSWMDCISKNDWRPRILDRSADAKMNKTWGSWPASAVLISWAAVRAAWTLDSLLLIVKCTSEFGGTSA